MPTPVKLPKLSKSQIASIDKQFDQATRALEKLGFEQGPTTKSRIFTLTYLTKNAKGYVSIRYDKSQGISTVLCEFYGRTSTLEQGLGVDIRLVDITPRTSTATYYKGLDTARCKREIVSMLPYMMQGVAVFAQMKAF